MQPSYPDAYQSYKKLYDKGPPVIPILKTKILEIDWSNSKYKELSNYISGLFSLLHDLDEDEANIVGETIIADGCPQHIRAIIKSIFVFSCILATVGTLILSQFQKDLRRYRENISKVRSKFPKELHDIANYEPAEEDPSYYAFVLYVQMATIWVAVVFVGWAIGFWKLLFCN